MNTLDKLNIAYTAPYAIGNMLSPRKAWEPIMPEMVRPFPLPIVFFISCIDFSPQKKN